MHAALFRLALDHILFRLITRTQVIFALLMLHPRRRHYLRTLIQSGRFDAAFYRASNPGMHWLFHLFPERHYILMGEGSGLFPNPDFSPKAYLRHNPDVAQLGIAPFLHFIETGHQEARLFQDLHSPAGQSGDLDQDAAEDLLTLAPLRGPGLNQAPQAVVIHLYYHDLWEEFHDRLQQLSFPFDLYVTLTYRDADTAEVQARIQRDWPEARVLVLPNRGRDLFPFVHLINAGWLDPYDAVCKFHSKKSPHREDGEAWRQHLIDGILPSKDSADLLKRFLEDETAAIWVADGQHYAGQNWWGSNLARCRQLLARLEITPDPDTLDFPAGSIYWIKPQILDMLRGLELGFADFDAERGQTDGTLAHVLERAIGILCAAGGLSICQTTELRSRQVASCPTPSGPVASQPTCPRYVSAFYLPQFHPTAENDTWWGKGFTEWTACSRARPQFAGHGQPCLPSDLGFYDLRLSDVMGAQATLARSAGIDAFCVYHYWFDGKRLLNQPMDRLLERPDIDFPFYLCWANESWRRNWDGLSGEVLMPQSYAPGFARDLALSLLPYFRDPRYQRPDGERPRFVIYRPEDMPDPIANIAEMRHIWRATGIGEVELGAVLFHVNGASPVAEELFDFWIEMPPHGLVTEEEDFLFGGPLGNQMPVGVTPGFSGLIYDYDRLRRHSLCPDYASRLPQRTIAGLMPSWDNTARRGTAAHLAWGAHPLQFERWARDLCKTRLEHSYQGEVMINAWNEWAEKAVLEPGGRYGHGYLNALRRGLGKSTTTAVTTASHLKDITPGPRADNGATTALPPSQPPEQRISA